MLNQTSRLEIQLLEYSLFTNRLEKHILLQTQEISRLSDKNRWAQTPFKQLFRQVLFKALQDFLLCIVSSFSDPLCYFSWWFMRPLFSLSITRSAVIFAFHLLTENHLSVTNCAHHNLCFSKRQPPKLSQKLQFLKKPQKQFNPDKPHVQMTNFTAEISMFGMKKITVLVSIAIHSFMTTVLGVNSYITHLFKLH